MGVALKRVFRLEGDKNVPGGKKIPVQENIAVKPEIFLKSSFDLGQRLGQMDPGTDKL